MDSTSELPTAPGATPCGANQAENRGGIGDREDLIVFVAPAITGRPHCEPLGPAQNITPGDPRRRLEVDRVERIEGPRPDIGIVRPGEKPEAEVGPDQRPRAQCLPMRRRAGRTEHPFVGCHVEQSGRAIAPRSVPGADEGLDDEPNEDVDQRGHERGEQQGIEHRMRGCPLLEEEKHQRAPRIGRGRGASRPARRRASLTTKKQKASRRKTAPVSS